MYNSSLIQMDFSLFKIAFERRKIVCDKKLL
jgi:hypothetical protein